MKRSLFAGLLCSSLVVAVEGVALAQVPLGKSLTALDEILFAKFDDGDGMLKGEEVGEFPWLRYDADRDGVVAKAEFLLGRLQDRLTATLTPENESSFGLLDWTGDGQLSGGELDGGLWLSLDKNGDKIVSRQEFADTKLAGPGTGKTTDATPGDDTPEAARAAQATFIAALVAGDERALYAQLHPLVRAQIKPAMIQMHFDIMKSQMGAIASPDAEPEFRVEVIDGVSYRQARQRLMCANGPMTVNTSFAKGTLVAFQLDAPQLEPELVNRLAFKYLTDLGEESKDFAQSFMPECEKFVRTLCDVGVRETVALLDPRVREQLKPSSYERLERIRRTFGPVKSLELIGFRAEAGADKGLDKFILKLEATRPGKEPETCEFSFQAEGLQSIMVGYSFEETLSTGDKPTPPPVPAPSTDDDPPSPTRRTPPPQPAPIAPPKAS